VNDPPRHFKVVRTGRELEMQRVDARLREAGAQLVLRPDGSADGWPATCRASMRVRPVCRLLTMYNSLPA
jgi:hypothetical protein